MPTIMRDVVLNAHAERVWNFLAAVRFQPVWLDGITSATMIDDRMPSAGTRYMVIRSGVHDPESWIVADWEPYHRMRLTEYRHGTEYIFRLEAHELTTHLQGEHTWPARYGVLERLLTVGKQQGALERSLQRLKQMIVLNRDIKLLHGMGEE